MSAVPSLREVSPAGARQWAGWFWRDFLPGWIAVSGDAPHGGYFDVLDVDGRPMAGLPKTVLTQARLLFSFSHLALLSGDPLHQAAALRAHAVLDRFARPDGLYRRAVGRDGAPTGEPGDALARSYDQSFVILALATFGRLTASQQAFDRMEGCWRTIEDVLIDPATGLLKENDSVADPAAVDAPMRAQNPHMHLYEAALQAFEMTGEPRWTARAAQMRKTALDHFLDRTSGTIAEFLRPDLQPLPGREGMRREVGHQCEWAWLIRREMALGGPDDLSGVAEALEKFALAHGFADAGAMQGAAHDAVSADATWREERFLLWPQTEAIKMHAVRAARGEAGAADAAAQLLVLMFERYFGDRPAFANQIDGTGAAIWPEALSRLVYHLVLALTEGAAAGLWPGPTRTLRNENV